MNGKIKTKNSDTLSEINLAGNGARIEFSKLRHLGIEIKIVNREENPEAPREVVYEIRPYNPKNNQRSDDKAYITKSGRILTKDGLSYR